ncbi:MAG: RecQ family ATP-dependent DNA helicase [Gemmatimonadota bacterium]|nr:RecQ family ATP-dependent DNA helicase [Gemmatimonadota bacterium]MDE2873120.1 RecQ family ATP-dependent DNA helicase [Gemmatimonadota bacterium]
MTPEPETRPNPAARAVLRDRFGFPGFRPGQEELVGSVLSGRDTLGVLPTGGGKTLCYQLPAFMMPGLVLVVSPLISLMQDQVDRARRLGLRAASLTSQDPKDTQRRAEEDLAQGRLDLLFCSPERLEARKLRNLLASSPVSLITIDEAHCISEWGHEFRPAFRRIHRLREIVSAPVLAVTATATPAVRDDITQVLRMTDPFRVVTSFDRPNIRWLVARRRSGADRIRAMVRLIRRAPPECAERALIVYAPTRRLVVNVRRALASLGVVGDAYHAALPSEERQAVQRRFMSGESNVVVATCAFGMGIDRGDVWAVFHYAFPGSLESYYQEAGRAGRDGEQSMALGFVHKDDWKVPASFMERAYPKPREVLRVLAKIRSRESAAHPRSPDTLLGPGGANVPHLKWLMRSGAIRLDPVLAEWIDDWPDRAAGGPPAVAGPPLAFTGDTADLGPLATARRQAVDRLRAMQRYCGRRGCRRMALLRYLGEVPGRRSCGSCDRCERRRDPAT